MSNKKTIIYLVTQSELGGVQQYVFDLAASLKDEFNIFVAFGEQGKSGELAKKLDTVGIQYFEIPHLKRAISPFNDLLALFEIIKLIKKIKPNIIHLNSSKISILGTTAAKICYVLRVPCYVIYTVHGWVFNEPMSASKKLFYKFAEKFTAFFKDKLICVCEYDKQIAIQEKICPEEKLVTVHNGISKIDFLEKDETIKILGSHILRYQRDCRVVTDTPLRNDNILLGTIGNLYKTKGFEHLIKAAKILKNTGLSFTLLIIGEGDERKKLENLITSLGLNNEIILKGRINNAARLLKAFDIFICSSVKEGFPYNILEAMQAGLPIVSTSVGGVPEMIENEISGLLTASKNPKAIAEKIIILSKNKELSNKLGRKAKEKSANEFTLESMIKKTKEIYNQL